MTSELKGYVSCMKKVARPNYASEGIEIGQEYFLDGSTHEQVYAMLKEIVDKILPGAPEPIEEGTIRNPPPPPPPLPTGQTVTSAVRPSTPIQSNETPQSNPPTEKQLHALRAWKVPEAEIARMTLPMASKKIGELIASKQAKASNR